MLFEAIDINDNSNNSNVKACLIQVSTSHFD